MCIRDRLSEAPSLVRGVSPRDPFTGPSRPIEVPEVELRNALKLCRGVDRVQMRSASWASALSRAGLPPHARRASPKS
eukprot:11998240-Alexandrium_andersonii.AAC.1